MGMRFFSTASTKFVSATLLALGVSSCAVLKTNTIEPVADAPPPPEVTTPGYAGVPHPVGLQIGDALALFVRPDAPKRESPEMKSCAADYIALEKKTKARDELKQGLLELVRKEPIRYHWCFYSKILELEDDLRKSQMLDERQRAVVEGFRFLAPLSRVFYREYHDSRYLRWAVYYYRRASELAFYRRVETSPGLTQELVGSGSDDATRGVSEKSTSVLEKYGIIVPERLQPGQHPDEVQKGEVLPSDAYVDTGSGVIDSVVSETSPSTGQASSPDRMPATEPSDTSSLISEPVSPTGDSAQP